ncbi:MAG: hypothetical protein J0H99_01695 [Rhodospirillales bacterium]|nr:hypothetical protein [Rhodospirillales bacterium]MBN8905345.1 hypothetical protein [Rhodospirillales bacterium]
MLMINSPAIAWPSATVAAYGSKPLVALVGADLGFGSEDVGPDEWTCARRLRYWKPNAVIIHGAAGEIAHYRLGVALALTVGRLAFIECSSRRVEEWRRFLGCPHTVAILPEGGVHPVAPAVRH